MSYSNYELDKALLVPSLLTPNKKPIQGVEQFEVKDNVDLFHLGRLYPARGSKYSFLSTGGTLVHLNDLREGPYIDYGSGTSSVRYVTPTKVMTHDFTFGIRFWADATADMVAVEQDSSLYGWNLYINTSPSGKLRLEVHTGPASSVQINSTSSVTGKWVTAIVSNGPDGTTIDIDGAEEATGARVSTIYKSSSDIELWLGRRRSTLPFDGKISWAFRLPYQHQDRESLARDPFQLLRPSSNILQFPVAAAGGLTISPSLIASDEAFFTHALTTGGVNITPNLIASDEAFFTHALTAVVTITPDAIASDEAFFQPNLITGVVTITPNVIASDETFFEPIVSIGTLYITDPNFITSGETFYTHTLNLGTVTIIPDVLPSGEVFYTLVVDDGSSTVVLGTLSLLGVGK